MATLAQLSKNAPQRVMIYGPPKAGKTKLLADLVNAGYEVILFDLDNGWQVLLNWVKPEFFDKVTIIQIPDTQKDPVGIVTVGKFFEAPVTTPIHICEKHGKAGCVVCKVGVDKITTLQKDKFGPKTVVAIDSVSQLTASAVAFAAKGILANLFTNHQKIEWDHYNHEGMLLSAVMSQVQHAKFHVICISHDLMVKFPDGSEKLVPQLGTKNFSINAGKFFDHVIRLEVASGGHRAISSTTYSPKMYTGTRSGLSMEKGATLLELLEGKGTVGVENRETPEQFATSEKERKTAEEQAKATAALVGVEKQVL